MDPSRIFAGESCSVVDSITGASIATDIHSIRRADDRYHDVHKSYWPSSSRLALASLRSEVFSFIDIGRSLLSHLLSIAAAIERPSCSPRALSPLTLAASQRSWAFLTALSRSSTLTRIERLAYSAEPNSGNGELLAIVFGHAEGHRREHCRGVRRGCYGTDTTDGVFQDT